MTEPVHGPTHNPTETEGITEHYTSVGDFTAAVGIKNVGGTTVMDGSGLTPVAQAMTSAPGESRVPPRPGEHRRGRHTAITGKHEKQPASVWRTPADGTENINGEKGDLLLFGWHSEHQADCQCCANTTEWDRCPGFVYARVRGIDHTMYVVPMPYDEQAATYQRYAIVDDATESMGGGRTLREGFEYHAALSFAASVCAAEFIAELER